MLLLNFYAHLPKIPPLHPSPHLGQKTGWRAIAAVQWMSIYYRSNFLIFHLLAPDIHGWLNSLRTVLSIMYCKQGYVSTATALTMAFQWKKVCTRYYIVKTLYRGMTVAIRLSIFLKQITNLLLFASLSVSLFKSRDVSQNLFMHILDFHWFWNATYLWLLYDHNLNSVKYKTLNHFGPL